MTVYWLEQTEADLPGENDWLSASEAARLTNFRFPRRRADWRLGRWTAKVAVAAYLNAPNCPPGLASIEIRPAPSGAPEVFVANQPADVSISLSHRGGVAACAMAQSGAVLGCDLELVEPRSEAFISDYFTPEEQALLAQADTADRFRLVALLWSAKESALKALHTGLRLDTRSVIVRLDDAFDGFSERDMAQNGRTKRPQAGEAGGTACPTSAPPQPCSDPWHPLQVRCTDGESFHGWWQLTGDLLRTLAAAPQPDRPILLRI
jgi:4'-phosphopantetheinyl transferase